MAQLPSGQFLIQQIDGMVHIFNRDTEEVLLTFDPSYANGTAIAQGHIWHDVRLDDEDTCYAIFWSGYFYAHASGKVDHEDAML